MENITANLQLEIGIQYDAIYNDILDHVDGITASQEERMTALDTIETLASSLFELYIDPRTVGLMGDRLFVVPIIIMIL